MYSVLLVIHVMVTLTLIGIILVQRSSADGSVLSSSSSTSFMSGRAAANFVTRATAVLAVIFILTSLGLGILTAHTHTGGGSIMDRIDATGNPPLSAQEPLTPKPSPAAAPVKPAVPRPE